LQIAEAVKNDFVHQSILIGSHRSQKEIKGTELFMFEMVNLLVQARRVGSMELQREKLELGRSLAIFNRDKFQLYRGLIAQFNFELCVQLLGKNLAVQ
jgi:hypothetical protein